MGSFLSDVFSVCATNLFKGGQTDRQTNRQTDKRCSIYSMMSTVLSWVLFFLMYFQFVLLIFLKGDILEWPVADNQYKLVFTFFTIGY